MGRTRGRGRPRAGLRGSSRFAGDLADDGVSESRSWVESKVAKKNSRHWDEEILTSQEARGLLKIGRTKLWELTTAASIPAYRLGEGKTSPLRYKKSDLLGWLERHRFASERNATKEKREETV